MSFVHFCAANRKYALINILLTSSWQLLAVLSSDPLFGMGANVALIFSGQYVKWVSNLRGTLAPGVDAWAVSLRYLMAAVVASGGVLLSAYKYMQDNIVAKDPKMAATKKLPRKKKERMTMKESAKFLVSSPYIRDLATLVISYGLCINIVEVSWKSKLKVRPFCWARKR